MVSLSLSLSLSLSYLLVAVLLHPKARHALLAAAAREEHAHTHAIASCAVPASAQRVWHRSRRVLSNFIVPDMLAQRMERRRRVRTATRARKARLCGIPASCPAVISLALTLLADATGDDTRRRRGNGGRRDARGGTRSGSCGLVRRLALPNYTVIRRIDLCPILP